VLTAIWTEITGKLDRIGAAPGGDLASFERLVRDGELAIGARLLAAAVATCSLRWRRPHRRGVLAIPPRPSP
jgi:hypothetical protein